jgi:hypothetical protein
MFRLDVTSIIPRVQHLWAHHGLVAHEVSRRVELFEIACTSLPGTAEPRTLASSSLSNKCMKGTIVQIMFRTTRSDALVDLLSCH